jgi:hypothetical protein
MGKGGPKPTSGGPDMKTAWKHYESGDVVTARREAAAVLQGQGDGGDKEQAADLLERTRFPKMGWILAATAAGLISIMLVLAIARS